MIGIYQIKNKINGKSYIGQSINIKKRWKEHINTSQNKDSPKYLYPLYQAFRKYGIEHFDFIILEKCLEEDLLTREKYYYNLISPLYNLADPNYSSFAQTPEIRERISESLTGRALKKETIQKLSKANWGEKNPQAKKVKGINLKTKETYIFNCFGDAAEFLIKEGLTSISRRGVIKSISRAVTGVRKSYLGFKWEEI